MPWPQIPTLSEQVARLEHDLKQERIVSSGLGDEVRELRTKVERQSRALQERDGLLDQARAQLNSITDVSLTDCQRQIKHLEQVCENQLKRLNEKREKIDDLRGQVYAKENTIRHQAAELTKVRQKHAALLYGAEKFLIDYREQIARIFEVTDPWKGCDINQGGTYGLAAANMIRAVPLLQEFKCGDQVVLKSGGPPMTISGHKTDEGKYECYYYSGSHQVYGRDWYFPEMIEKLEEYKKA